MSQLALLGGNPVRTRPWPAWPIWDEIDVTSLRRVFECGAWGIDSPIIEELETRFAQAHGVKHAISCTNGTDALIIALRALGVRPGHEVIVPPYSFFATVAAPLLIGATPVFVDIDPRTYNLNPELLEAAIGSRTRCVIPVHVGGNPADLGAILEVATRHGIHVLEDAAQAHFAHYDHRPVGSWGSAGTFSFQSSKNHSAGEGGIICTEDDALLERLFSYQNCGRSRGEDWYEHRHLAGNSRLSAFQAAVLLSQMDRVEVQMAQRDAAACYLREALAGIPGLAVQERHARTTRHAHHAFIVRFDSRAFGGLPRRKFLEALHAEGVPCTPGYRPLHTQSVMRRLHEEAPFGASGAPDYAGVRMPECERIARQEAVWIPQHVLLSADDDLQDVVEAIEKIRRCQAGLTR
jgi:dTDP-4-amino-4,6-dideoxygalactose transaminase